MTDGKTSTRFRTATRSSPRRHSSISVEGTFALMGAPPPGHSPSGHPVRGHSDSYPVLDYNLGGRQHHAVIYRAPTLSPKPCTELFGPDCNTHGVVTGFMICGVLHPLGVDGCIRCEPRRTALVRPERPLFRTREHHGHDESIRQCFQASAWYLRAFRRGGKPRGQKE